MQLPAALRAAIEREAAACQGLNAAARDLSAAYRAGTPPRLDTEAACAAYAATRLPATYAAARHVFAGLPFAVSTVTDLGAGAGAASWAAAECFPGVRPTLVERNSKLLDWSRRLGPPDWQRQQADLAQLTDVPVADLVVFSYSLGELTQPGIALTRAWQAAILGLVVIEPGTRAGFGVVQLVRETMHDFVAAPCPQRGPCPMAAQGDWCHFAARVERTALHRHLKDAELGHEDEKFSYVVLVKQGAPLAPARIVRHPAQSPGRIDLRLCTPGGLSTQTVRKRDGEAWRRARKAVWGDAW